MKPDGPSTAVLFDRLRAEHETGWLEHVFVEPVHFDAIASMRSTVVFGASGAGKTVLRMALQQRLTQAASPPRHLVVNWQPSLPVLHQGGSQAVQIWLLQLLDMCGLAVLHYIGCWPQSFTDAPDWAQETIVWFVSTYVRGDQMLHVSRLAEHCPPHGIQVLRDMLARPPRAVLFPDAPEGRVIAELVNALQRFGIDGVWVFVDGLEPWIDTDADQLTAMLRALLATLTLFEEPGFVLKLMIPAEIEPAIATSGGIVRRRLDVYRLEWSADKLVELLERRLALVCARDTCKLTDICDDESLVSWLSYYGGRFPRGWLELVRALVEVYLARGARQPLSRMEWLDIQRQHPPRLWIDTRRNMVFLGHGEVTDMQPGIYKILCYLYEQRPRLCTRSELFYKAYRGLTREPDVHNDPGWEPPKDWSSVIDTLLWRLRRTIEPDPRHPVYIISKRGQGVRLDNAW